MKEIQITGRFKVSKENLPIFKKLVAACIACTKEKDKGTLQYDWFSNNEETEWIVRESFVDSKATLDHMDNLGDLLDAILEVSKYRPEIYGNPSQELKNDAAGFVPIYFPFYRGLNNIEH